MITALAGGVGAARMLRGLAQVVPPDEITAIVNTGDDAVVHGLSVSPDLDTVMYTLAGRNDEDRGWGLADESWRVMTALEDLGVDAWFRLGDRDLATHLYRSGRLAEGQRLSQVTAALCEELGVKSRLLPMSDDPVATRLTLADDGAEVSFQDYFVRLRHGVAVRSVRFDGADSALPAPGVIDALDESEAVVVCPSNPVVSIGPILAVAGIADTLRRRRDRVVAVSPIVAGAALKGPADRLLEELGEQRSVVGVARRYAAVAGTLVVDEADHALADAVEAEGMACVVAPTVMRGPAEAARLAGVVLEVARGHPFEP